MSLTVILVYVLFESVIFHLASEAHPYCFLCQGGVFFLRSSNSLYGRYRLFILFSAEEHLYWFRCLVITDKADLNICLKTVSWLPRWLMLSMRLCKPLHYTTTLTTSKCVQKWQWAAVSGLCEIRHPHWFIFSSPSAILTWLLTFSGIIPQSWLFPALMST